MPTPNIVTMKNSSCFSSIRIHVTRPKKKKSGPLYVTRIGTLTVFAVKESDKEGYTGMMKVYNPQHGNPNPLARNLPG